MLTKHNTIWTTKEILFLEENYKDLYPDELAQKLNRSTLAVINKIQKLGLKKLVKPGFLNDQPSFKIWMSDKDVAKYILAPSFFKAVEKYLIKEKLTIKVKECEQNEADVVCQGNDNRRTKKYYKFI